MTPLIPYKGLSDCLECGLPYDPAALIVQRRGSAADGKLALINAKDANCLCAESQTLPLIILMTLIHTDQTIRTILKFWKSVSSVFIRGEICFLSKACRRLKQEFVQGIRIPWIHEAMTHAVSCAVVFGNEPANVRG
jgi:hypothetical protein